MRINEHLSQRRGRRVWIPVSIVVTITVEITKDTATPMLASVRQALEPENLLPVLGRSVTNTVRDHFDELESSRPNKLGGQRTHYYSGARQRTSFVVEGTTAIIGIRQVGIRLRYYGGTVHAGVNPSMVTGKPTKYLTIPVTPEAYGKRAADFEDLAVLWGARGPYGLGRVTRGTISRGGGTERAEVLFILVEQVTIQPDPTMLPPPEALQTALQDDFNRYVALAVRRAA
jgi:hypothetical protein